MFRIGAFCALVLGFQASWFPPAPGVERALVSERPEDTTAVMQYLREQHYSLVEIADARENYYVVIASHLLHGGRYLLTLKSRDSVVALAEPADLGPERPSLIRLESFDGSDVDGLIVTWDSPVEGDVGTVVWAINGERLVPVYTDGEGACRPAFLRDLDRDGRHELITHLGDPSELDCGDDCHLALWQELRATPAWTSVLAWSGDSWVAAEERFPRFYEQLAGHYQRAHEWVLKHPHAEVCRSALWFKDRQMLAGWAARARELASMQRD